MKLSNEEVRTLIQAQTYQIANMIKAHPYESDPGYFTRDEILSAVERIVQLAEFLES